jgi:hypothetical protein
MYSGGNRMEIKSECTLLVKRIIGMYNRWISHITPILTFDELHDFILLWEEITSVTRVEDSEDEIKWKWPSDGIYTT